MTVAVRILGPDQAEAIEAYLCQHADTAMFLRSNIRAAGMVDHGKPLQGTYAGAMRGTEVVGMVGQAWNGMLLLQADNHLLPLIDCATRATGRRIAGMVGPLDQVTAARDGVPGLPESIDLDERELLFALALDRLEVPSSLTDGSLTVRNATSADERILVPWRVAYEMESVGRASGPELDERAREVVTRDTANGLYFVAERADGTLVACTAFNARLPDIVQVGGVWTPPEQRCHGYARAAVAGSLLAMRAGGTTRAVLFTGEQSHAQNCYRAIGFQQIGNYGVLVFSD